VPDLALRELRARHGTLRTAGVLERDGDSEARRM
jgi:hypothetical protein